MSAPLGEVRIVSMVTITALQDFRPEAQIAALATTFRLMAEMMGVEPQDIFQATGRMMDHAEATGRPEFRAIRSYMKGELVDVQV